jgi:hypothetical protein
MGVCGGNSIKKDAEEEKKKKEEEDKSKNKDISKEKDKDKDKDINKKPESRSDKITNPIINKNNLQPSKDNSISKQVPNQQNKSKNETQKIFPQNNAPLPSAINSVKMNMDGTSSVFPLSIVQNQNKSNKNKSSAKSENVNIENEEDNQKPSLLKNEHLIAPMEGQIFMKTMTDNQMKNLENYNINFYPKGEHIILSFGDCFDIFNDFFTTLVLEHQLNKEQPIYNYDTFFDSEDSDNYSARGIAFNIPNDYYDIYLKSEINSVFNNNNIIFNTNKKSRTTLDMNAMNNAPVKQVLNMNEKSDDFFKEFNNDTNNQKISNLLSTEAEKCNHLRCLHFLGNIFDGNSMGILCNFVNDIQEDYRKVLKLTHLKYFDSFEHKAFSKIKNYLYSISNLYDKCDLVNFFNSNKGGDILSCITAGERINEYSSGYSINQMLSDLLINPKLNYVYSNGLEVKEKDCDEKYVELLYEDCKEDRNHIYYKPQISSLTIYKGNKVFGVDGKMKISQGMANLVDRYINGNRSYYNFYDINKNFDIYDFMTNLHQTQYFVRFTEQFFMDFIQNYNMGNFLYSERQLKEETINSIHGILNNFKELWRYNI